VPYKIRTAVTDNGTQFTALAHCRYSVETQEEVRHPEGLSVLDAFDDACEQTGIKHRLTKPGTLGQTARSNA
jgi:hypothetical protein